jgi:hypothetical protein
MITSGYPRTPPHTGETKGFDLHVVPQRLLRILHLCSHPRQRPGSSRLTSLAATIVVRSGNPSAASRPSASHHTPTHGMQPPHGSDEPCNAVNGLRRECEADKATDTSEASRCPLWTDLARCSSTAKVRQLVVVSFIGLSDIADERLSCCTNRRCRRAWNARQPAAPAANVAIDAIKIDCCFLTLSLSTRAPPVSSETQTTCGYRH